MNQTEKIIREEIGKLLETDGTKISGNASLIKDVGLDSLNILEMFDLIEEKFGIIIDSKNFAEMKTINDVVRIIEECKSKTI